MNVRQAVVQQLQGITFTAKGDSNHWVVMDGPESFDGSSAGTRPKELLLFALGGCTASDVVNILKKKRVALQNLEIRIRAEESEEHPKVFTAIHLEYVARGTGITPADVERAIELSTTRYCSVSAMLSGSVKISHSYRIEDPTPSAEVIGLAA